MNTLACFLTVGRIQPKRKTDQVLVGKPHHVATRQISRKTFHSENLPKEIQNTSKGPKSIAGRKRKTTTTAQSDLTTMNHYEHQCFTSSHVLCLGEGDAGQLGLGEDILSTRFPKLLPPFQKEVSNIKNPICQISAGGMHSVCCSRDNKIYTFGCNDDGALGRICEDDSDEKIPQSVNFDFGGEEILQITTGDSHTAVLTKQGMVFGWGSFRDESGILGLVQAFKIEKTPRLLYSPTTPHELNNIKPKTTYKTTNIADSEDRAIKIVSGNNHILILLASGRVLSLGSSEQGQLGRIPARYCCRDQRKGIDVFLNPKPVEFPLRNGRVPRIKDIFATSYGSFAVDALSVPHKIIVYAWGLNNYCQLGLATSTSKHNRPPIINNKRLKNQMDLITHGNNENISKTSKIKSSKSVLPTIVYFPIQIKRPWYFLDDGTREICNIVGGPHHTLVLDTQNDIYSFGRSDYGRLGLGPDVGEIVDSPTRITTCNVICSVRNEPNNINNQDINEEISNDHKKSDNEELNNKLDNKPAIKRLKLHANHISATTEKNDGGEKLSNISAISAGECVSYAITNDGQCFSWGMGTTLQLAHAKTAAIKQHSDNANDFDDDDEPRDSWYPCCMTGKQLENRKVMQVSAGGQHTLLLTTD